MTEEEWLKCEEPTPMLECLQGKVSDRKLRLFAVACCRHIWEWLPDPRSRMAVETAEKFADGEVDATALLFARRLAMKVLSERGEQAPDDQHRFILFAACDTALANAWNAASMMPTDAAWPASGDDLCCVTNYSVLRVQSHLIRDVFGNPFCQVPFDCGWVSGSIAGLARSIYDDRAFDRMPILADALQDAGCDDADILAHLRDPNATHVRGCWALDLVLGKE